MSRSPFISAHVIPDDVATAVADGADELNDGAAAGFELAPHAASASTSTMSAMYLMSSPCGATGTTEPYGYESTPTCRLSDVTVTLASLFPTTRLGGSGCRRLT